MESTRVVEVLHDRGLAVGPRWLLGSGFLIKTGVVITAAHNLGDSEDDCGVCETVVRSLDGLEYKATVLARSDAIDLALLAVSDIKGQSVKLGRIERDHITVVRDVIAVGFPNYKYADERPPSLKRQPAQPVGSIPTVEGLSGGDFTLKIEAGEPAPPFTAGTSPWEGLSGAGVFVGECLIGVVIEHHLSEGMGSLRLIPISSAVDLPGAEGALFRAILGVDDLAQLEPISSDTKHEDDPVLSAIVRDLQEVISLGDRGLLTPTEVSALKLTAYKEAKGWR